MSEYTELEQAEISTLQMLLEDIQECEVPAQRYQAIVRYKEFCLGLALSRGELDTDLLTAVQAFTPEKK